MSVPSAAAAPTMCGVFRGEDPDCLVDAALACPFCLHGGCAAQLVLETYDARVECECRRCGGSFVVYLDPDQALRVSLRVGTSTAL